MTSRAARPGFWAVVVLLLGAARKRAVGRFRRQRQLRRRRGGSTTAVLPLFAFAFGLLVAAVLNAGMALELGLSVVTAERVQAEAKRRVVVEEWFAGRIANDEADAARSPARRDQITRAEDGYIGIEAQRLVRDYGGDETAVATRLRATLREDPKAFLSSHSLWWQPGALPDIIALMFLIWWGLMLVCQGEGLELDVQRTRNPMWEWLFSHPARPGAIFLAEMIAPVAANPLYLTAPLFPGVLFGCVYGWSGGIAGAVLVGVPVALTLACVAKAIEIRVVLRLSPRVRGAVLGVMGWFGFASMMAFCLLYSSLQPLVASVSLWLAPFGDLPWPPARMLLGRTPQGYYAFSQGLVLCWLVAVILILGSVAFSVASLRRGLAGQSGFAPGRVAEPACFGRMPLYRKELLWFRRDGRALVRAILVPLSLAALQIFNLRWLISNAADAWNTICGFAILFGTYFLLTLGPQSLASEGQALWIAQTWPRGLEILLKTKAKLWTWIATAIVELVFVYAAWRYPANLASIVMVGVLWWVFARSLAEKTVTLATVRSRSDELQKPPAGLWWAATLGTMSFAVGVFTRQWALAVAGVVYSILTAAAMWQNFRYRLPFLADPWSETLPPPPTLLHAMVAISAMVEGVSALSALALWGFGRDRIAPINAGLYGVCAIVTALAVSRFLVGRGVAQRDIWLWRDGDRTRGPHLDAVEKLRGVTVVVCGDALGAALGLAAHLYLSALHWWPQISEALDEVQKRTDALPNARAGYAVIAVGFAPFAEEFLFRGLLYRALDREWGGWRAVVGAGAFFAIYHPALSWAPVTVLGVINALLFKRTGQLAPAVAAHITYNAVVLAL